MANIVELIIRGNDQSAGAIRSSTKNLEGLESALSSIKGQLASIVSISAMVALAKSALDLGGALTDMSEKFGVSATDLSALSYPAKMVGVELEDLGNAFKFMQKNLAAASNPISDQAVALKLLGVELKDLKGKAPIDQFFLLADAFNKLEDDENAAALKAAVFGRAWDTVYPLIKKGSAEIKRGMKEAKDAGIALTESEIKNLDDYGDAYDKFGQQLKSTAGRAIIDLGEFYNWMFRQNDISLRLVQRLNNEYDKLAKPRAVVKGKIADIIVPNPEPPPKKKAKSLEEELKKRKEEEEARKKALEDAKRLEEHLLKLEGDLAVKRAAAADELITKSVAATNDWNSSMRKLASEGMEEEEKALAGVDAEMEAVNAKLREQYGITAESIDINEEYISKLQELLAVGEKRKEQIREKAAQDRIANSENLKQLDAELRAQLEAETGATGQPFRETITEVTPYTKEDAFNAAMYWHNTDAAVRLLNEGLYEHFRIIDEGREKVSALQGLYATVFRGKDGMIADFANMAVRAFNSMADALTEFVMTGKMNFRDFANSVISDIARIMIQATLMRSFVQPIMGAFGFSMPFGGGKAIGGPVVAGTVYDVGERGPEKFIPTTSGTIVPNGGGGGSVTVNIRNEGGEKVRAKSSSAFIDARGTIIDIVLEGISLNTHGLRDALGGA